MNEKPESGSREELQKRARKAALLSGFVLPGLGEFYLGEKLKGIGYLAGTLAFIGYFLYELAHGFQLYWKAMMGISDIGTPAESIAMPSIGYIFLKGVIVGALPGLILWVASSIDAYRSAMTKRPPQKMGGTGWPAT